MIYRTVVGRIMPLMTRYQPSKTGRRAFLLTSAAVLTGACASDSEQSASSSSTASSQAGTGGLGGESGAGGAGGVGGAGGTGGMPLPLECIETAANLLGPYYRPGAPFRDDLTEPEMAGTRVQVSGRVFGLDCERLSGALLDVWQADDEGDYDNDGVNDPPPDEFVLRGRLYADDQGEFSFRTIIPGHYLDGAQYRPAHIHITVSAPGYAPITTQLYFDGDMFNDIDPFIVDSLIMKVAMGPDGELVAPFDFVLAKAS